MGRAEEEEAAAAVAVGPSPERRRRRQEHRSQRAEDEADAVRQEPLGGHGPQLGGARAGGRAARPELLLQPGLELVDEVRRGLQGERAEGHKQTPCLQCPRHGAAPLPLRLPQHHP